MREATRSGPHVWIAAKLGSYFPRPPPCTVRALVQTATRDRAAPAPLFANPFTIDDLLVFDDATLRWMLGAHAHGVTVERLAAALHDAPPEVVQRITCHLPPHERTQLTVALPVPTAAEEVAAARQRLLDSLFWELTYWKTPELYDELTAGERLHPGIFRRLAPAIRGRVVLDAGAGCGRATLECLRLGAAYVYAVEPAPGLLDVLRRKLPQEARCRVTLLPGRFDALPLEDDVADLALSCSAFTAEADQGGGPGLDELRRVTRPGGSVAVIWPRPEDYGWLAARGFHYVALPVSPRMSACYLSLEIALRIARRFYARKHAVQRHLLRTRRPTIPYALLGANPPHDYCWQRVAK